VPDRFRSHFQAPVLVDNDVNVMALGVYGDHASSAEQLLVVKVATGIGCGTISGEGDVLGVREGR
jgi:predicted NBD/HSP70 family sugar kinase